MTQQEYENLTGTTVSVEDYRNIIEPMYMATDLSKQEFVKTINSDQFKQQEPEPEPEIIKIKVPLKFKKYYSDKESRLCGGREIYAQCYGWDLTTGGAIVRLISKYEHHTIERIMDEFPEGLKPCIRTVNLEDCTDQYYGIALVETDSFYWIYQEITGENLPANLFR